MKKVVIIWCVALLVAVCGVFYINYCIDSARSGFVRDEVGFPSSMYYDEELGQIVYEDLTLTVDNNHVVGVESAQGGEDNTGYRIQPAQANKFEYRVYTIIQE